ncbi:alpha/beta fold hydrolase [Neisseria dentiae]|uniref:alpha/beta fold hydrolase n=1 Tax=Neisseria dentiae TaxID=194197 RepID=UPI00211D137C|nr:alpha/beta hydrolase [Neisseria dentiae]MCQ9327246.1 alpha/beta hydrolase [Neisseria dentiae]
MKCSFKKISAALKIMLVLSSAFAHAEQLRYFGQQANAYQSSRPYGFNPQAGHFIQTGDTRIYYEIYGKGSPVVVLHGGMVGSTLEMGQFIDQLAKNHQVIAVSTRGHGQSESGTKPPTYLQKADDLNRVLAKINAQPVDIIGFSDGAYTGYFFARQYPAKVKKLVAIGAGEWKKGARNFNLTLEDLKKLDAAYWQQQIRLRRSSEAAINRDLAAMNAYYNSVNLDTRFFSKIAVPTLLVVGELDQNAPLDSVISAYKAMPNAQLAVIPNAAHPVFTENFPAVWAVVQPFLNGKSTVKSTRQPSKNH